MNRSPARFLPREKGAAPLDVMIGIMAFLAALGGYIGAHYSRLINQAVMRRTVAAIGFMTAAYFFVQNYAVHPVR